MVSFDITKLPTPCYVTDERLLEQNAKLLHSIAAQTGCKILLAQKAFSMFAAYPMLQNYLDGTTASSLFEARLGHEEFGKETHVFAPAYKEEDLKELLTFCDHIVFNTPSQWKKYRSLVQSQERHISCGLRINPEYAEIETDIYNPCFTNSRLGTTLANLTKEDLDGLDGLHFHTMCEQNSDVLKRTLEVVEEKFGQYFSRMKWINFGGGHHITRPDYDCETLISCINHVQETYGVTVYLEPGEAVALNAGFLVSEVMETFENGMQLAILDTSAACHMPDVLEMPYRPEIIDAKKPLQKPYTYRLGGPTCLAGDVIGDYSFDTSLKPGDKLVFCDMAIYSMVKNNTFNGINLPSIVYHRKDGNLEVVRSFQYDDFKNRLS